MPASYRLTTFLKVYAFLFVVLGLGLAAVIAWMGWVVFRWQPLCRALMFVFAASPAALRVFLPVRYCAAGC